MGAPGIALANSISAVAQLVVLRAMVTKHVNLGFDRVTLQSAGLSTLCATLAGLGVWGFQVNFADALKDGSAQLLLSYGLMVLIGAGVFLGLRLFETSGTGSVKRAPKRRRQKLKAWDRREGPAPA